jgi:Zn-dependent membrane protease YugP
MNATLRTTLGWVAAVTLNVGALLFVVGLLLPRTGGDAPVLGVGVGMCAVGIVAGACWLAGRPHV